MAITSSSRLGITRWSADTDTVSRAQFDGDNGKVDDLVAMDMQGTLANRPAAAAANRGLYYFVTGDATAENNDRIWRSTGATWIEVLTGPAALAQVVLAADGNISITNIPATFRHLRLVCHLRSIRPAVADTMLLQFNGDTAANYDWQKLESFGTTIGGSEAFGATSINLSGAPAANAPAGVASPLIIDIPDYSRTDFQRTVRWQGGYKSGTATGNHVVAIGIGAHRSTAAVSSLSILGSIATLAAGSIVSLYGIKGAGQ